MCCKSIAIICIIKLYNSEECTVRKLCVMIIKFFKTEMTMTIYTIYNDKEDVNDDDELI